MIHDIQQTVKKIKENKPVILNLSNYVTMDIIANALLAIHAAPIMSAAHEELNELMEISSALVINIGTLDTDFINLIEYALYLAKQKNVPFILDPVGAGASQLRTKTAKSIMTSASIVRGNASEIMALLKDTKNNKGVESTLNTTDVAIASCNTKKTFKNTVVISGKTDFVSNGSTYESFNAGSAMMNHVTGMGCAMTAIIAAFQSVIDDSFEAAKQATCFYGLCGSVSEKRAQGPASFRSAFIDTLYNPDFNLMRSLYV